jgi:glycosyltransferase involved in cell wall biosynthesis
MNKRFEKLRESWLDFDQFKSTYQKVKVEEYPNKVLEDVPEPKISVHIITFQHERFIRQAIESVLMQKVEVPWEIIIGDDESTDGTREICIEYAKKYPSLIRLFLHKRDNNIKLFDKPTHLFQYYYNSFNCRGKYLAICSGDDYWTDENKLQKQYDVIANDNSCALIYHKWKYSLSNTAQKNKNKSIDKEFDIPKTQTWMILNIYQRIPPQALSILQEDTLVELLLCSFFGKTVFLSDIKPSYYRVVDNSVYSIDRLNRQKHRMNMHIRIFDIFKGISKQIDEECRERLSNSLAYYHNKFGSTIDINGKKNIFTIAMSYGILSRVLRKISKDFLVSGLSTLKHKLK